MKPDINELVEGMLAGSEGCLSRLITLVENGNSEVSKIISMLSPRLRGTYCVGITGAPGVGKSTLIDALITVIRSKDLSVGILAADPSSIIHGGAVLGDRIRMPQHFLDDRVFIRSMATRGNQSGLPVAIGDVIKLLDAFGEDIIIVETVGVGQTQIGVRKIVDTVVLVLSPESGDSIQFVKAGIIEIADIIVVNKADRGNANILVDEYEASSGMIAESSIQKTVILTTEAVNGVGINELSQELENRRRAHMISRGLVNP